MKFPVYQSSCCQFKTLKLALRIPLLSDLRHGCFATCFTVENKQMLRLSFHYSVGSWHQYRFRFHLQCLNVWIILTNSKFSNAIPRFQIISMLLTISNFPMLLQVQCNVQSFRDKKVLQTTATNTIEPIRWWAKCVIRLQFEDGEYSDIRCSLRDSTATCFTVINRQMLRVDFPLQCRQLASIPFWFTMVWMSE